MRVLVIKNVEIWWMTLFDKFLVSGLPNIANNCGFTIGNRNYIYGFGVMMIDNKDVAISATEQYRKSTCLV